jgi:transcriptional regulator with XRE-family HTH domain
MSKILGSRIRQQRARLDLTQAQLAALIGISATSMNAIEAGETDPRASRILKLAEVLDVTTDYLFGRDDRERRERPLTLALAGT